jgi:hypothetical protein
VTGTKITSFDSKAKAAFIMALALTGITFVFFCLAVIAGAEPGCAGHRWPEDHRPIDSFGLLLGAAFIAVMFGRVALGSRSWRGTLFKLDGMTVPFEFITWHTVIGVLVMQAIVMGFAIAHWHTIATECLGPS